MKKNGFTLIELMIAIAIIGVVFGVIITSAAAIQRSSRDTQRRADLATIQSALEQYHTDTQVYLPSPLPSSISYNNKVYLQTIPSDPQSTPAYSYQPFAFNPANGAVVIPCNGVAGVAPLCAAYCIFARTENTPPTAISGNCTGLNPNQNPTTGYNYAVTSP